MGELSRMWREMPSRYRMQGKKCGNCNTVYFPPRDVCTTCHRDSIGKMKDMDMEGTGEILSFTIVHEAPPAFLRQKPYIIALIRLSEGPVITGQIVDIMPEEIDIGTKVRSVFRRISEDGKSGVIHYGYKFVPV
ncbi:MAG: Zn-ribbon domain-containing OB-fold protein [Candidatus Thermoplasmatota archaeon]|jgi:uncharacterized OB-fold protein|nr:Zn-ribbon domain-containing OB-fold protein [Candidatus Thermoplasmatota archaeon]MCL5988382.1 Zn-ribbon domain-containing OB-fold protein [Candidatus Thermoplasmatota archaeon]